MVRAGKMIKEVLTTASKKPVTTAYPAKKFSMQEKFRGKLIFHPERCIGCKMCMRDCPSAAITITALGEKQFSASIDLGKCIYCAQCVDSCLKKALESSEDFELAQLERAKLKITLK